MIEGLPGGIIVSIQGYQRRTIEELALEAVSAGCAALRVDKRIDLPDAKRVPLIGLHKTAVQDVKTQAYITATVEEVEAVAAWADLVAVDYRVCNANLREISRYCREHKLRVVADVGCWEDWLNIRERGYYYTFVATTLAVFKLLHRPNLRLVERLAAEERRLIAEGNFSARKEVQAAFECGAHAVCIGGAISNVYKLTRKYTEPWEGPTLRESGLLSRVVRP